MRRGHEPLKESGGMPTGNLKKNGIAYIGYINVITSVDLKDAYFSLHVGIDQV